MVKEATRSSIGCAGCLRVLDHFAAGAPPGPFAEEWLTTCSVRATAELLGGALAGGQNREETLRDLEYQVRHNEMKLLCKYHAAAKRIFDIMAHFDAIGERGERCPQLLLEVYKLDGDLSEDAMTKRFLEILDQVQRTGQSRTRLNMFEEMKGLMSSGEAEMALIDDDITRRLTDTKTRCVKEFKEQKEKKEKAYLHFSPKLIEMWQDEPSLIGARRFRELLVVQKRGQLQEYEEQQKQIKEKELEKKRKLDAFKKTLNAQLQGKVDKLKRRRDLIESEVAQQKRRKAAGMRHELLLRSRAEREEKRLLKVAITQHNFRVQHVVGLTGRAKVTAAKRVSFNAPRADPEVPASPIEPFIDLLFGRDRDEAGVSKSPRSRSQGAEEAEKFDLRPRWDEQSVFGRRGRPGGRRPSNAPPPLYTGTATTGFGVIPVMHVDRSWYGKHDLKPRSRPQSAAAVRAEKDEEAPVNPRLQRPMSANPTVGRRPVAAEREEDSRELGTVCEVCGATADPGCSLPDEGGRAVPSHACSFACLRTWNDKYSPPYLHAARKKAIAELDRKARVAAARSRAKTDRQD
jgi:hypothetical protein